MYTTKTVFLLDIPIGCFKNYSCVTVSPIKHGNSVTIFNLFRFFFSMQSSDAEVEKLKGGIYTSRNGIQLKDIWLWRQIKPLFCTKHPSKSTKVS